MEKVTTKKGSLDHIIKEGIKMRKKEATVYISQIKEAEDNKNNRKYTCYPLVRLSKKEGLLYTFDTNNTRR